MGWALDLDGVLWLADSVVPGGADAVARLRAVGEDVIFCTNNSSHRLADVERKLERLGIPAQGDVLTSATAAAALVAPGERVLVCAGAGVVEAIEARGAVPVTDGPADAVLVGFHREFDYERLRVACTAVRGGARLLATNDDATYPTPAGPIPGGGAILAAVATGSGQVPLVAGKPYQPMVDLVAARLGPAGVVVGDRPDTDGRLAEALGYRFALVLTGVTLSDEDLEPRPHLVAPDLATAVDRLLLEAVPQSMETRELL